jgi:hypothetical protein
MKNEEHRMQAAFVKWLRLRNIPHFAIPNGGARSAITGRRLKDEGVSPGVPDMFIPCLKMFIEFKTAKGRVSSEQQEWIEHLQFQGYIVHVCRSTEDAIEAIKEAEANP